MSITAIIQARLDSTRLPRKVLLPLGGKPLLQHIIETLQSQTVISRIVLATSDEMDNRELSDLAQKTGIDFFEGSRDNVLDRFYNAVQRFGGDYIMRVTGDNPLISGSFASRVCSKAVEDDADLASISGIPLGTAVEIIKRTALEQCFTEATTSYQKEHVTPYIKENPELFKIIRYESTVVNPYPDLRLTVDTPEDFEFIEILFEHLYKEKPVEVLEVIDFIKNNPHYMEINSHIKQRPMTHAENK